MEPDLTGLPSTFLLAETSQAADVPAWLQCIKSSLSPLLRISVEFLPAPNLGAFVKTFFQLAQPGTRPTGASGASHSCRSNCRRSGWSGTAR